MAVGRSRRGPGEVGSRLTLSTLLMFGHGVDDNVGMELVPPSPQIARTCRDPEPGWVQWALSRVDGRHNLTACRPGPSPDRLSGPTTE